ncbi:MAG TPA: ATP synthase F1 subunit epsilon, partial [Candidatus Dormibacteraeota bacterium]|nr:ATP synthase F1 subunit epsilon [Candidatus Dormibacteraeota bacterium]
LPKHIPLLTPLRPGEVMVRNDGDDEFLFVAGGFLEVLPDKVVILADAAERAEDIDEARAEEARKRAQQLLEEQPEGLDTAAAAVALERAVMRLRVAELRRRHRREPPPTAHVE